MMRSFMSTNRRNPSCALSALAVSVLMVSTFAGTSEVAAQDGVSVGELRLGAGLGAGAGYNSNLFLAADNNPDGQVSSVSAFVEPRIGLSTIEPRSYDFDLELSAEWMQYISEEEGEREQSGLSLTGHTGLRLNPIGDVSAAASFRVRRTNDPAYSVDGSPLRNWRLAPGVEVGFHPGGIGESRLGFSGYLRGTYRVARFEERSQLDRNTPGVSARLQYNFLPRTALYVTGGLARTMYVDERDEEGGAGEDARSAARSDSTSLNGVLGFTTAWTRFLGTRTAVGYASTNHDVGPGAAALTAEASVMLQPVSSLRLTAGWRRGLEDSPVANALRYDGIRLEGSYRWNIVELEAYTGLRFVRLDSFVSGDGELEDRTDRLLDAGSSLRVAVARNVGIGVRYRLRSSLDEAEEFEEGVSALPRGYVQHLVSGGVDVRF